MCSIRDSYISATFSNSSNFFTKPSKIVTSTNLNTKHKKPSHKWKIRDCTNDALHNETRKFRWLRSSPLHKIARLNPSASAVPELMDSTTRCLIFFNTEIKNNKITIACNLDQSHSIPLNLIQSRLISFNCIQYYFTFSHTSFILFIVAVPILYC